MAVIDVPGYDNNGYPVRTDHLGRRLRADDRGKGRRRDGRARSGNQRHAEDRNSKQQVEGSVVDDRARRAAEQKDRPDHQQGETEARPDAAGPELAPSAPSPAAPSPSSTDQVTFDEAELLASHRYAEPLVVAGVRCHGGFDDDGTYVSPRTATRVPAIAAWQAKHRRDFGTDLLDLPLDTWPEHYPNVAQGRFLIESGVPDPISATLTRVGTGGGPWDLLEPQNRRPLPVARPPRRAARSCHARAASGAPRPVHAGRSPAWSPTRRWSASRAPSSLRSTRSPCW